MEVNMILSVMNQDVADSMIAIYESHGLSTSLTLRGTGTARSEHLSLYGLQASEKAVLLSFATGDQTRALIRAARMRLFLDIPGHGIIVAIPIKSVGGGKTLAFLTNNAAPSKTPTDLQFDHELIIVVLNEGYTDDVMNVARAAGAMGGTILHAKGTAAESAQTFLGVSLAEEKEVLLIVATTTEKTAIMKAIASKAGPATPAGAIAMSLPVTSVAGLRTASNTVEGN